MAETLSLRSKPIRTVLRWQVLLTGLMAAAAGFWLGHPAAVSALLGGLVNFNAVLGFVLVGTLFKPNSAGDALLAALRAEAVKVALIVLQLWLVLTAYKNVVLVVFIGAFVVTVVVSAAAAFVRDE